MSPALPDDRQHQREFRIEGPLNRHRVLDAAVALADDEGLDALTMRRLVKRLGVEAMSLRYHVASKSAFLDGVAELVVSGSTRRSL